MRILRVADVVKKTGLSRATIYRRMREGCFPPKRTISKVAVGWREDEIDAWILSLSDE